MNITGVRGGAATVFYPLWHLEVESLLVLKNNRGVEENRVRHMDYGVQLNKLMYQRLIQGGDITLFSPSDVPGLYDAFFANQDEFERLYVQYEQDDTIRKRTLPAVELFSMMIQERASTGRIYIQNVDHCNTNSPFDSKVAPIRQSNLCVAPETKVLTDQGYFEIQELEGQAVNVWNGQEFSETTVHKTGIDQYLLTVTTDSGQVLECTPDHKWYIVKDYSGKTHEVRTRDLKPGDKLIKFDLPIIDGSEELLDAYVNGFYSADGCLTPQGQRVYLYGEKRKLKNLFKSENWTVQDEQDREYVHYNTLKDKYFVPTSDYTLKSRLEWLAGVLDGDGCIYRNGTNEQITLCSTDRLFMTDIQLMLQTMGINTKIKTQSEAGSYILPLNDGTGLSGSFECNTVYRLLITSVDAYKLLDMGLKLHRLVISKRVPQRCARHFIKVLSVEDEGRMADTYCFTEPKRHMGMFNGILTGQCLEIALPTKPMDSKGNGEIALCTLSAFNLGMINRLSDLEELSDLAVRALDALLDYQHYPLMEAERSTLRRRSLGVGVINYAYYLAKNGVKYSDGSANELTHQTFEAIQYYLLKASNELAREQGVCEAFSETTYSQGILPIDRYKKTVDELCNTPLLFDWEVLRSNILAHGLRNSTLTALMPSETSSQISNATNGIEPPRGLVTVKQSKDGILKQVVPEINRYRWSYELLWQLPNNDGYLQLVAIMQKFVDQAISSNTSYDPKKFPDGKVPMKQLLRDLLTAYKYGIKTLYYHNTRDGSSDGQTDIIEEDEGCAGGACKI